LLIPHRHAGHEHRESAAVAAAMPDLLGVETALGHQLSQQRCRVFLLLIVVKPANGLPQEILRRIAVVSRIAMVCVGDHTVKIGNGRAEIGRIENALELPQRLLGALAFGDLALQGARGLFRTLLVQDRIVHHVESSEARGR
jgi:hypothetical protein